MIRASAPGKVVLWGEYAVLRGAPALVLAINREAVCEIDPSPESADWVFTPKGMPGPAQTLATATLLGAEPPDTRGAAHLAWHALKALGCHTLPASGSVTTDSQAFFHGTEKLGLGSSAAVCTTLVAAFATMMEQPFDLETVQTAHHQAQGKAGSGIDVAAAFHGGSVKFEKGSANPWELPDSLQTAFFWSGHSASTTAHLSRFADWLESADPAPLARLSEASTALFETHDALRDLARYCACLKVLDQAAGLGIYSTSHTELEQLANECEVVYKPCGAGGGDVGVAFSERSETLTSFIRTATAAGYQHIPLEEADHGIRVTR